MTNHRALIRAFSVALLAASGCGLASAADTQALTVSATISGVCKFFSSAQTLSFGTAIDPSAAGPIPGTGAAVTYKCTKGTAATGVTANLGLNAAGAQRNMKNTANADLIPYSLTLTADTTAGGGFGAAVTPKNLTITSEITSTGYANASAGDYSDTVTLSILP